MIIIHLLFLSTLIFIFTRQEKLINLKELKHALHKKELADYQKWDLHIYSSSKYQYYPLYYTCFTISSFDKQKTQAYQQIKIRSNKLKSFLKKQFIIPSFSINIQSDISSQYFSKSKKWSFNQNVMVIASYQTLSELKEYLKKKGILQTSCFSKFEFNQPDFKNKISFLIAFNNAKHKLSEQIIKQFPYLQVDQVQHINEISRQNFETLTQSREQEQKTEDEEQINKREQKFFEITREMYNQQMFLDVRFEIKYIGQDNQQVKGFNNQFEDL